MGIFSNLTTDGLEKSTDRLGGYTPLESGIYKATIKALYAGQSKGGAMSVTLIADVGDREYRETLYITNRQGENFFRTRDGKKAPLPGFTTVNDICLITTGKELCELDTEEKVVKIWDPDVKDEVPKAVPMITEAIGQQVALGIVKQVVNRNEKNSAGEYVPTEETREENVIDRVFHPDLKFTVAEARDGKSEPAFWDAWAKHNTGKTRDRTEKVSTKPGTPPKAGAPGKGASPAPRKSLFPSKQS